MTKSIYDFTVKDIDGKEVDMKDYKGKTLLVVNVASKCGFTPQYEGLERLQKLYAEKGLNVLGFPCNQFGSQEPGSEKEIASFCDLNYQVTFPMFAKVDVNGAKADPLFSYLCEAAPGLAGTKSIKWNFTKFLIDANGKVLKRYAPQDTPEQIEKELTKVLP